MASDKKIQIGQFCDLQGVSDFMRKILEKRFAGKEETYADWYTKVSDLGVELSPIKQFTEESVSEDKKTASK